MADVGAESEHLDPLTEITGGDRVAARALRDNLTAFAEAEGSSRLGQLVRGVLDGRHPASVLREDTEFVAVSTRAAAQAMAEFNALDPDERQRLIAEGERLAEELTKDEQ